MVGWVRVDLQTRVRDYELTWGYYLTRHRTINSKSIFHIARSLARPLCNRMSRYSRQTNKTTLT